MGNHPASDRRVKPEWVELTKITDQTNAPILNVWSLKLFPIGPAQPVLWMLMPGAFGPGFPSPEILTGMLPK
jgi:hypothetical protein